MISDMKTIHILLGILLVALFFAWYALRPEVGKDVGILAPTTPAMTEPFSLVSSAFENNGKIPSRYTCDGSNVSPPLAFSGVPEGTKSLALIMDDPDVPKALRPDGVFVHWVVFNMPPETREIKEGEPAPGIAGVNGAGANAYTGPCPPPQYEPSEHRYIFRLYALDTPLALPDGATKGEVLSAMEGHTLGVAELIGRYSRK